MFLALKPATKHFYSNSEQTETEKKDFLLK